MSQAAVGPLGLGNVFHADWLSREGARLWNVVMSTGWQAICIDFSALGGELQVWSQPRGTGGGHGVRG